MSRRMPLRLVLLAVAALVAMPVTMHPADARAATCASASARPGAVTSRAAARATLCLLNAERRRHFLRRLRPNSRLAAAARRHSRDMVRRRYFSHTTPSGTPFDVRIRHTGYLLGARRWMIGENLA